MSSTNHEEDTMSSPTFRAAVVRIPGGPDSIEIIDVPVVEPGPGEVRVGIAAAAVNPVDLAVAGGSFHAMGLINQPERTGLGWDFAGTLVATGPGVDLAVGTRVAGMVDGFDRDFGTYAERSSCRPPASPSFPTGWTWSRRRPCRSTGWPPPRSSTCSATPPPPATGCW
jgi:NADPH:quinone reductase-like Zn-dependent oxidoreductase